jgi:flagellar export protein FliJ
MTHVEERLEEARVAVSEAHRGVRALEILEERDREAWVLETKREEQKINDDLISSRSRGS